MCILYNIYLYNRRGGRESGGEEESRGESRGRDMSREREIHTLHVR